MFFCELKQEIALAFNPWSTEILSNISWRPMVIFNLEYSKISLSALFALIRIPMLWVYGHYKYYSYSAGIDYRRQVLTSKVDPRAVRVNPLTAELFNLNFHPLEVVSRWCDPQLQVSENYSDWTKWRSTLCKSCWLMSHFIFNIFKIWYLMC